MQIIIIESAEALAEQIVGQIENDCELYVPREIVRQSVLSCLHPIDVPSDAGELARVVVNEMESPFDTAENRELKAAALITAHDAAIRAEAAEDAVKCIAEEFNSEMRDLWGEYEDNLLRSAICRKEVVG